MNVTKGSADRIHTEICGKILLRGRSFMTSATLGGGGVNQILTFADRGEPKSDILLTHTDGIKQSDILLILFS